MTTAHRLLGAALAAPAAATDAVAAQMHEMLDAALGGRKRTLLEAPRRYGRTLVLEVVAAVVLATPGTRVYVRCLGLRLERVFAENVLAHVRAYEGGCSLVEPPVDNLAGAPSRDRDLLVCENGSRLVGIEYESMRMLPADVLVLVDAIEFATPEQLADVAVCDARIVASFCEAAFSAPACADVCNMTHWVHPALAERRAASGEAS